VLSETNTSFVRHGSHDILLANCCCCYKRQIILLRTQHKGARKIDGQPACYSSMSCTNEVVERKTYCQHHLLKIYSRSKTKSHLPHRGIHPDDYDLDPGETASALATKPPEDTHGLQKLRQMLSDEPHNVIGIDCEFRSLEGGAPNCPDPDCNVSL
jgi:hypothetical protein